VSKLAALKLENEALKDTILIGSIESHIDKQMQFINMATAMRSIPSVSAEAAALIDLANDLICKGTDLKGSDDLVPGLESHVLNGLGLEANDGGFLSAAKEIGNTVITAILKFIASITNALKSMWGGVEDMLNMTETAVKIVDGIVIDGNDITLPKYRYDLIVNTLQTVKTGYLSYYRGPSHFIGDGSITDDDFFKYIQRLRGVKYGLLEVTPDSLILKGLDTKTYIYTLPEVADGKIVGEGRVTTEDTPGTGEMKTVDVKVLKEGLSHVKVALSNHDNVDTDDRIKQSEELAKKVSTITDPAQTRIALEMVKLDKFLVVTAQGVIVSSLRRALRDIKNLSGTGANTSH